MQTSASHVHLFNSTCVILFHFTCHSSHLCIRIYADKCQLKVRKTQPEKLSNIKFAHPFNLASDPEERIDLSTERPDLVQAMVGFMFDRSGLYAIYMVLVSRFQCSLYCKLCNVRLQVDRVRELALQLVEPDNPETVGPVLIFVFFGNNF